MMRAFDKPFLLLLPGCALLLNIAFAEEQQQNHKTEDDQTVMDKFGAQKGPAEEGAKVWLAVVLFGVVPLILIALIISIIAFVVCRKRKSEDDDGDEEEEGEDEEDDESEDKDVGGGGMDDPTQEPNTDYEQVVATPAASLVE